MENISKYQTVLQNMRATYPGNAVEESLTEILAGLDFPTTRMEYWKYTRTAQIANKEWQFAAARYIPAELPVDLQQFPNRLVYVNGHFDESHSTALPEGITHSNKVEPITDRPDRYRENPFLAMADYMPQPGYSLEVAAGKQAEEIYVVHVFTGKNTVSQPVNSIRLGKNSHLKITEVQIHVGDQPLLSNAWIRTDLDANAQLHHDIVQLGSAQSFHTQHIDGFVARDSRMTINTITLKGNWVRNNSDIRIDGENCEANINGFYIPSGKEHVDNHTVMDHKMAHSQSNELYRGVLMGKSTGVFNGKVFVRQDAQKTNAFQSNGNILVSDTASMNSKPELEIYADDVKCSHGSTTGQFDDQALFYLRARGLSLKSARKMLVAAFAADVLEKIENEDIRHFAEAFIANKLTEEGND